MSVEDLKKYAKACSEDPTLRDEAKKIGIENIQQQMEHAKKHGYHWNENDVQEFAKEMQADGELSEDDLEDIAGGVVTTSAAVVSAVAGVVGAGAGVVSAGTAVGNNY